MKIDFITISACRIRSTGWVFPTSAIQQSYFPYLNTMKCNQYLDGSHSWHSDVLYDNFLYPVRSCLHAVKVYRYFKHIRCCLSVYLFICLPVGPSVCPTPPYRLSVCLFSCLPVYLSVFVCPPVRPVHGIDVVNPAILEMQ
jgi:hypothetical protein